MRKAGTFLLTCLITVCSVLGSIGVVSAESVVTDVKTFPQVQTYQSSSDAFFRLKPTSRFYVISNEKTLNNPGLTSDVQLINSEFAAKSLPSPQVLPIVFGPENAINNSDIVISLEEIPDTDNAEGYTMDIKDHVRISAPNRTGLFYGLRTLEKALIANDGQIRAGKIVDYPAVEVRSVHLDIARKSFSKDWITSMIKDLSYQNINSVQLHLSENEGFRLESDVIKKYIPNFKYPSNGYFTKDDMKDILDVAKQYHIEIVPSLDTPGHMGYVINQMQGSHNVTALFPNDNRAAQTFNIFDNENDKKFLIELIEEFAKFFSENGSKHMNIGGDEFLQNFGNMTNDQYIKVMDYFNEASAAVKKYGMTPRAWNDGLRFKKYSGYTLDKDIEIAYWAAPSGTATVNDFEKAGHKVINYTDVYMYYALSSWWENNANATATKIYNEWTPGKMSGLPGGINQDFQYPYPDKLVGASYALWADDPNFRTEAQLKEVLRLRTRAMADKTWSPQGSKPSYSDFVSTVEKIGRVPGYDTALPTPSTITILDANGEIPEGTSNLTENQLKALVNPVLREYRIDVSKKLWRVSPSTRFIIEANDSNIANTRLKEVVQLLNSEFAEKEIPSKTPLSMVYATSEEASANDIVVTVDTKNPITEKSDSSDAYRIDIHEKGIKVTGSSENAVMYGLRTIQNLLITNERALVYGTIIDYPQVAERRLHVDMARKYITKEWLIQHIRQLSYLKLNAIQLHFNENLGFRIESETDPAIVSPEHLTKQDILEVIAEAQKYGVDVIPSLDTPGHVEHILKFHPEYGLVDSNGIHSKVALDITNPEAVNYVKSLYKEYMELFKDSKYFHIGGDEFIEFFNPSVMNQYRNVLTEYAKKNGGQTWLDATVIYINDIAELVHEEGFIPRIWNDGMYFQGTVQNIPLYPYVEVDYWSKWYSLMAPLSTFVAKGVTNIYNVNASYFYYVLRPDSDGRGASFDYPDNNDSRQQDDRIFNDWHPGVFQGTGNTVSVDAPYIGGAALAIWADNPKVATEDEITTGISKALHSMATKSWNPDSNKVTTLVNFRKTTANLGNVAFFEKGVPSPIPASDIVPSEHMGKVTLRYVTNTGQTLQSDVVKYGKLNDAYRFTADEVYGYRLTSQATFSGSFNKETPTYTFKYELYTDKSALQNEVDHAISEANSIKETFSEYKSALVIARNVIANPTAKQKDVDEALKVLKETTKKVVTMSNYELYVETSYPAQETNYVSGYPAYQAAIANAKSVLYKDGVTVEEIQSELQKAKKAKSLLMKPDGIIPTVTATDNFYVNNAPGFDRNAYDYNKMLDHNNNTKTWFGQEQKAGKEIVFSFPKSLDMSAIQVVQPSNVGNDSLKAVDVEVANVKGEWKRVGNMTENELDKTITFDKQAVKFVRILLTQDKPRFWYQITDVNFTYDLPNENNELLTTLDEAFKVDIANKPVELVSNFIDIVIAARKAYVNGEPNTAEIQSTLIQAMDAVRNAGSEYGEVEVILTGPNAVMSGKGFELKFGLNNETARSYAQDITVTYDPNHVEFILANELKEGYAIVSKKESLGQIQMIMAYIGSDNVVKGELLGLQFKAKTIGEMANTQIKVSNVVVANSLGVETQLNNVAHHLIINHAVDKSALISLITKAQSVHDGATEGDKKGQYPSGSKSNLLSAINNARAVADNSDALQPQVDQAATTLTAALQTFTSSVLAGIVGDTNGDNRISIGDLAIVAKFYGAQVGDTNWEQAQVADVDGNSKVDIMDLAFVATKIISGE